MRPIPALPRSLLRSCQLELISAAADKSLQSCPSLCDPIDGNPPGSAVPGILDKNTGVGCHFFLQCVKVKSESKVAQSCLTLSDPMDCSLPGSSVRPWGFPGKSTGVGCHCLLQELSLLIIYSFFFKILILFVLEAV